jgi:ankyrin repeat protein
MFKSILSKLISAIMKNDVHKVSHYLKNGVDPDGYEDKARIRPLHFSVAYGAYDSAKLLIEAGADPLAESEEGTPLDLAHEQDDKQMLLLFSWRWLKTLKVFTKKPQT